MVRIEPEMLRDIRVTTAKVEARTAGERIQALGEIRVNEDSYAEVGTPIPARVVKLHAAMGARVRRGDALAVLESADVGRLRAAELAAGARLRFAKARLAQAKDLGKARFLSKREILESEAAHSAAEVEARGARAALAAIGAAGGGDAEAPHARFFVRAPIAGTVIERSAVRGQFAEPARTLFRIADLSRLWLTLHVFEREAVRVRVGGTADVTFSALPSRAFSGKVALIGREVDPRSRTVPVRVEIANEGGVLMPGMSASARLGVDDGPADAKRTILAVPRAAVQRNQDVWSVFVPKGEGIYELRTVARGRDLGGEVELLSGVRAGDTVVTEGAFLLKAEHDKQRHAGEAHEH